MVAIGYLRRVVWYDEEALETGQLERADGRVDGEVDQLELLQVAEAAERGLEVLQGVRPRAVLEPQVPQVAEPGQVPVVLRAAPLGAVAELEGLEQGQLGEVLQLRRLQVVYRGEALRFVSR